MKKIDSVAAYSTLIENAKKTHGQLIYNTMFLPKDLNTMIDLDKLYYEEAEANLFFLCKEKDFYKGYFFVGNNTKLSIEKKDKPVVVELVYSQKLGNNPEEQGKVLADAGFQFYVKNIRTKAAVADFDMPVEDILEEETTGFYWRFATDEDKASIYHLWSSLDIYDSIIPDDCEFCQMIAKNEIVCILREGKVCAVFRLKEENKKTVSMWLVVVDSQLRGKGLGKRMHQLAFHIAQEKGYKTIWQWSDEKNERILKTVFKMGFVPDGTESIEYILK